MCSSFVYLIASRKHGFVWAGITTDLVSRIWQHKKGEVAGESALHSCIDLVWHATFDTPEQAEAQLKRLARWPDAWKTRLIEENNPDWIDLWARLDDQPTIDISPAFANQTTHTASTGTHYPIIRPMLQVA